jgi:hypothetical protein
MSAMKSRQTLCSERATPVGRHNSLIWNASALAALQRESRFRGNK